VELTLEATTSWSNIDVDLRQEITALANTGEDAA
jgi:hypothetical protein